MFKSLTNTFAGTGKLFKRLSAPVTAVLGAVDIASTLNDDSLSKSEKTKQLASSAGGTGGALAGAAAGAAIGSVIPGIGTAIGGLIGGALGAFAGESLGEAVGETIATPKLKAQPKIQATPKTKKNSTNLAAPKDVYNLMSAEPLLPTQNSSVKVPTKGSSTSEQLSRDLVSLNKPTTNNHSNNTNTQSLSKSGQIVVNNEITVNATQQMDHKALAEQIKVQLEQREMAALRELRFNYLDEAS